MRILTSRVLLSRVVDHILLLAVEPASQNEQSELHVVRHHGSEDNTLGPDDCKAYGPWPGRKHRH